jgi:SOS-response transcriptional repressor LexA
VKGRFDDRDRVKAQQARQFCETLTAHDHEPWHYVLLLENAPSGRTDIAWWEQQSTKEMAHLLRHHEDQPLLPQGERSPRIQLRIVPAVPTEEQYRDAVPVYDLAAAAGAFSQTQIPQELGWARIQATRRLGKGMFVARVAGRSMEPGIHDGSWALFRAFEAMGPSPGALDGRRVVVQLRDETDPETGGSYTLKRWRIGDVGPDGEPTRIDLRPDNIGFPTIRLSPETGDIRVIAEFLETVG